MTSEVDVYLECEMFISVETPSFFLKNRGAEVGSPLFDRYYWLNFHVKSRHCFT